MAVDDPKLFDVLSQVLEDNGVVIMPCDTIYGFVGIAPETDKKIRKLKGREGKSFLRLIAEKQWLSRYTVGDLPEELSSYWPGALTVIFPAKKRGTVALRMPNDPLLLKVMKNLGQALFSTSVNVSGAPALWRIADILRAFENRVDLVVDAGDRPRGVPSTIVDVTERPFRLLRRGAVDLPDVLFTR
jgi:L-threonylcarbamoyladenylate synthase